MEDLVKLVSQKTGLPEAQAKLAVDTVLGFLKTKLPAPLAGQLDGFLAGGSAAPDLGGLASSALGGMFGKK
jgi:hypothetical protein